jgi:hypothetical protein
MRSSHVARMPMREGVYRPRLVDDYGGAAGVAMTPFSRLHLRRLLVAGLVRLGPFFLRLVITTKSTLQPISRTASEIGPKPPLDNGCRQWVGSGHRAVAQGPSVTLSRPGLKGR